MYKYYLCSFRHDGLSTVQQERKPNIFCRYHCGSVVYCSHAHEQDDWDQHRKLCSKVRRHRKHVTQLSLEYGENNGIMDIFDRSNGMVFVLADPVRGLGSVGKNYLDQRTKLVHAYMDQAVAPMWKTAMTKPKKQHHDDDGAYAPSPHWNRLAMELALEQCLDLLHLDPVETDGSTRALVAHGLLVLERYQELYDYVKFWNTIPWELRVINRREATLNEFHDTLDFVLGANTFLNVMSPQPIWEDQSQLALRVSSRPGDSENVPTFPGPSQSDIVTVLYLALGKLLVYQAVEGFRIMSSCMPIESDLILAHIAAFVGIQADWLTVDPPRARRQCHELLSFANTSIPKILQDFVRLGAVPAHDRLSSLELLSTAWMSHAFAWNFLLDFIQSDVADTCTVPRNEVLQRVYDQVYESNYMFLT